MLFEFVVEEWIKRDASQRNKASSLYQLTKAIERDVLPAWSGRRIDEIGKRDVLDLLNSIMDRGAVVSARRTYAFLARFFKWTVERDILAKSPMAGTSRPGSETSRERVLTDDELARVWKASSNGFGTIAKLLILTGARREEIGQLRWSEINGDTITLAGSRTKTGEPRTIPLSAPARELLAKLPRIANSDFVFTVDGVKPIAGWSRAKVRLDEACGVADWRIHDIRRTVATGLQKLGVNLQTIEAVLGHTSGSCGGIVGVYQRHSFDAEKRAALESWGKHLLSSVI